MYIVIIVGLFMIDWIVLYAFYLKSACLFMFFAMFDDCRFYHVFINFYYNVLWGIKFIIFISLD